MSNHKYITLLAAVAASLGTNAQTIETEVVIDREITPRITNANRPAWVVPEILSTRVETRRLSLNEYTQTAPISRSLPLLDAAAWADSVMRSPYRGYISAGYLPVYNLGVDAAYRFVNDKKATAGASISYHGATWTSFLKEHDNSSNDLNIQADAALHTDPGTLSARVGYNMSQTHDAIGRGSQTANIVDLTMDWKPSHTGALEWDAAFDLQYTGFARSKTLDAIYTADTPLKPVHDLTVGLSSSPRLRLSPAASVDLGIDADLRHISTLRSIDLTQSMLPGTPDYGLFVMQDNGTQNMGLVTLRPAYSYKTRNLALRLGLRVDFNIGGIDHDTRLAPDIDLQWSPTSMIALFARAGGGQVMNTSADLWKRNPWMTGVLAYERSHINADLRAGVTFGSFHGFWSTLYAGWTQVDDWLRPVMTQNFVSWQKSLTYDGFNYGLELGYTWRDMVSVTAHADGTQHGKDYRRDDNAKWALGIAAKVRAAQGLFVEAGYDARLDRYGSYIVAADNTAETAWNVYNVDLDDATNLFAGVSYDITPAVTVYIKVENILNHRYSLTPGIQSRGTTGLLGASFRF